MLAQILNAGSEAVELSTRITDVHAKRMTSAEGPHAVSRADFPADCIPLRNIVFFFQGWRVNMMCLEKSFYGRTYRAVRFFRPHFLLSRQPHAFYASYSW